MRKQATVEIINGTRIITHSHNNKEAELKARMKKIRAERNKRRKKSKGKVE